MESGFEINIALNGKHFFATDLRSARTEDKAKELYKTLKEKFPESEGYTIMVTYEECIGHFINFD